MIGLTILGVSIKFADVVLARLGPLVDFDNHQDEVYDAFQEWLALYHGKVSDDMIFYYGEIWPTESFES